MHAYKARIHMVKKEMSVELNKKLFNKFNQKQY